MKIGRIIKTVVLSTSIATSSYGAEALPKIAPSTNKAPGVFTTFIKSSEKFLKDLISMPKIDTLSKVSAFSNQSAGIVNALAKSSAKILKDKSFHKYGEGTLEVYDSFINYTNEFLGKLNEVAEDNVPEKVVGSNYVSRLMHYGRMASPTHEWEEICIPKFVNCKAVIKKIIWLKDDWTKFNVNVDYYGQKNPEFTNKIKPKIINPDD